MASLAEIGTQLAALPLSAALRSSPWAYPALEIVHLAGLGLLFGSIAVVDLRLAGLWRGLPVLGLLRHVLPITALAFAALLASGVLLLLAHADELTTNPALQVKLLLIAFGLANAVAFHAIPYRALRRAQARGADMAHGNWNLDAPPPAWARVSGLLSLLTWLLVITAGRLIAYV